MSVNRSGGWGGEARRDLKNKFENFQYLEQTDRLTKVKKKTFQPIDGYSRRGGGNVIKQRRKKFLKILKISHISKMFTLFSLDESFSIDL